MTPTQNGVADKSARAATASRPSPQAVLGIAGIANAIEDFARSLESGGGDNASFALNQSICCSGQDCGCRGSSVGDYLAYEFREFGKAIMANRTLTDPQRMLWRDDVEGICQSPDMCFEYGDHVRCGPCAIKQATSLGVESDLSLPYLPEVYRMRRELAAAKAMSARQSQDPQGLGPQDASAVPEGNLP